MAKQGQILTQLCKVLGIKNQSIKVDSGMSSSETNGTDGYRRARSVAKTALLVYCYFVSGFATPLAVLSSMFNNVQYPCLKDIRFHKRYNPNGTRFLA